MPHDPFLHVPRVELLLDQLKMTIPVARTSPSKAIMPVAAAISAPAPRKAGLSAHVSSVLLRRVVHTSQPGRAPGRERRVGGPP